MQIPTCSSTLPLLSLAFRGLPPSRSLTRPGQSSSA